MMFLFVSGYSWDLACNGEPVCLPPCPQVALGGVSEQVLQWRRIQI